MSTRKPKGAWPFEKLTFTPPAFRRPPDGHRAAGPGGPPAGGLRCVWRPAHPPDRQPGRAPALQRLWRAGADRRWGMSTDDPQGFLDREVLASHTTQQAAGDELVTADWLRRNNDRVVRDLVLRFAGPSPNRLQRRQAEATARKTWRQLLRAAVAAERGGRKG